MFFFFFSSRRRHTRSLRDWSSDVCSSDLASFVDGCGGKSVFPRMWDLAHHLLAGSIVCKLEETRKAMRIVAERNRVISEGAGACAVAAGLSGKCGSGKIVCVVGGGNIGLAEFSEVVTRSDI